MPYLKKSLFIFLIVVLGSLSQICLCIRGAGAVIDPADPNNEVELSYHGQLGFGTGLGMADKWCSLPNFNFDEEGGVSGWVSASRSCDTCHIGAEWDTNKPLVNCQSCHPSVDLINQTAEKTTIQKCYACHKQDTAKRGDIFDPNHDVHIVSTDPNRTCSFCHTTQDHQIARGFVIDTSEDSSSVPEVNCIQDGCHSAIPHTDAVANGADIDDADKLDLHYHKVACETCHTDTESRPSSAMSNRNWSKFKVADDKPVTQMHTAGWLPEYKWYDGQGALASNNYMPILGYAERKSSPGAKIYPFNVISVTWFIKNATDLDEPIPVRFVKKAGIIDPNDNTLKTTTETNMRNYDDPNDLDTDPDYPAATLVTEEMNFNISHSIVHKEKALACDDCHGITGRQLLDWVQLGYADGDPRETTGGESTGAAINPLDPNNEVEQSYHGQLGFGTRLGMADKWCALPNFNFTEEGGVSGWVSDSRNCDACHIGAKWDPDKPQVNCQSCHPSVDLISQTAEKPTIQKCYTCHKQDTAKRGDIFDPNHDVHIVSTDPNRTCSFCHTTQDHQIARGSVIDTSEDSSSAPEVNCTQSGCHTTTPHMGAVAKGATITDADKLDAHYNKLACETCHTDTESRPSSAMSNRNWSKFYVTDGKPVTQTHITGWLPEYKWYDGQGPLASNNYMPILGYAERKNSPGAKIYPFNVISVTWFIKNATDLDEPIPVRFVKKAGQIDATDTTIKTTTETNMRNYDDPNDLDIVPDYPAATLVTREMNFNISHSIVPKEKALTCDDCHGTTGRQLLDWVQLGYADGDPRKTTVQESQGDLDVEDDWGCFISSLSR